MASHQDEMWHFSRCIMRLGSSVVPKVVGAAAAVAEDDNDYASPWGGASGAVVAEASSATARGLVFLPRTGRSISFFFPMFRQRVWVERRFEASAAACSGVVAATMGGVDSGGGSAGGGPSGGIGGVGATAVYRLTTVGRSRACVVALVGEAQSLWEAERRRTTDVWLPRAPPLPERGSEERCDGAVWHNLGPRPSRPLESVVLGGGEGGEGLVADALAHANGPTLPGMPGEQLGGLGGGTRLVPGARVYVVVGPAGSGKRSLALALAGALARPLCCADLRPYPAEAQAGGGVGGRAGGRTRRNPVVRGDGDLERLCAALPPRALLLLEHVDAVIDLPAARQAGTGGDDGGGDDDGGDDGDASSWVRAASAEEAPCREEVAAQRGERRIGAAEAGSGVTLAGLHRALDEAAWAPGGAVVLLTARGRGKTRGPSGPAAVAAAAAVSPCLVARAHAIAALSPCTTRDAARRLFLAFYGGAPGAAGRKPTSAERGQTRPPPPPGADGAQSLEVLAGRFAEAAVAVAAGGDGVSMAELERHLVENRKSPTAAASTAQGRFAHGVK